MVKKNGGGRAQRKNKDRAGPAQRELALKADDQQYALVTKMLGNMRLTARCGDGRERLCHIRGSLRVRINLHDWVLVSLRSFQDAKADVILKYNPDEVRALRRLGEIERDIAGADGENAGADGQQDADMPFEFDDEVDLDAL